MITYINTYDIATQGHNSSSTYTFATQGFNVYVEIVDITPTPTPSPTPTPTPEKGVSGGYIPKGVGRVIRKKEREKHQNDIVTGTTNNTKEILKKRVKVCVVINDVEYCKTKIVKDRPNLTIDDIDIKINDKNSKPKITIVVKK